MVEQHAVTIGDIRIAYQVTGEPSAPPMVLLVGHSMGAAVAYLVTIARPDLVARLVIEDASPAFPRDRPVPGEPTGPVDFDWPVVPAIINQVNQGDPETWDLLKTITG
jgi:3-oxoadipate enol-lactonase